MSKPWSTRVLGTLGVAEVLHTPSSRALIPTPTSKQGAPVVLPYKYQSLLFFTFLLTHHAFPTLHCFHSDCFAPCSRIRKRKPIASTRCRSADTALHPHSTTKKTVTDHVLPLVALPHPFPITPSSRHLHKSRTFARRQALDYEVASSSAGHPPATLSGGSKFEDEIQQPLGTFDGTVYFTNITLAARSYTVVIDTGSSDTWVASSTFVCTDRHFPKVLSRRPCRFGQLYDAVDSETIQSIEGSTFGVRYADGEYLTGNMAVEDLGIGGGHSGKKKINLLSLQKRY